MGNFDIHQWQAKHLTKLVKENTSKPLNESAEEVAYEALNHMKQAMQIIEQYKEQNQISSEENQFNEIEVTLETAIEMLQDIAGEVI